MRLQRCWLFFVASMLVALATMVSECEAEDTEFVAIPESQKALYHFDFKKWFYTDDVARKHDIAEVEKLIVPLQALKPKAGSNPRALLDAIVLSEKIWTLADRVWAYGRLRTAIDTTNATFAMESREGDEIEDKVRTETSFIVAAIIDLPQKKFDELIVVEPGLKKYEYFLMKSRKATAHHAGNEVEAALSDLSSHLDPFQRPFRNLMIKRSPNATINVGGTELKVTDANNYAELLKNSDRTIRQKAFEARMATYRSQGDLFAYALFEKTRSANKVAGMRKFADAADEAYESLELNSDLVERVLKVFRDNASLAIRFQKAEAEYQRKILGLSVAAPWDVDAFPKSLQPPLHTIGDATKAVQTATSIFGPEYQKEIRHLLDPNNGRLDIVPGPNREDGDFTTGAYGPSWVFFMHGYEGQTDQVVTLAHEAAHAVHFSLLNQSGVPYYYADGARYFVEGCAKVNELLILDTLAKQASNDAERLYYKRQIASKLASVRFTSMYWSAFATSFEREVVKRIKNGQLTSADQIHDVWGEFGRLWSIDFDKYPDLKYTWPDTHHFLTTSRKYSQYLFAWVVALAFYEKAQSDPSAGEHFTALMKRGFSDEAAVLLKKEMGVVLDDPALIERMFKVVEARVANFENAATGGGK
jgi:oligoendopeptidase F